MARMFPLVGLWLITLCGFAFAQGPEDQSALLAGIKQAFLTGSPVPEIGTGPGRDQANALRQLVIAVQAGTDGTDGQKQKLRQEIQSLSAQVGNPPQNVIDDYLARAKGHTQPGSGRVGTAGTLPGTPQVPGRGSTLSMAPGGGTGSPQLEQGVGGVLNRVRSQAGGWNTQPDSLPDASGDHGNSVFGRTGTRETATGAQLRAGFSEFANAPPCVALTPKPAEMRAASSDVTPYWNPSGHGDFLTNVNDYVHSWLFLKSNADNEKLAHVEQDAKQSCAGGVGAGCVWNKTAAFSGRVVTSIQHQGEDLTSSDMRTRQKAVVALTPLAVVVDAPEAASAIQTMHRAGYTASSIATASLAVVSVAMDVSGFGAEKAVEKGAADGAERIVVAGLGGTAFDITRDKIRDSSLGAFKTSAADAE